jgi:hypothetical protein
MFNYLKIIIFLVTPFFSLAQNMVISGNGGVMIHNGGKLIFTNATPDNILVTGQSGGIITSGENAQVIFKNVNQLGSYTVPFASSQGTTIPFTFNITQLGSNSGDIYFTTWETDVSKVPYPSSVLYITDASGGDNSNKVINRFWKIDLVGYTNKPKGEYGFTYDDNDLFGTLIFFLIFIFVTSILFLIFFI